jgi:hypothetical protein
MSGDTGIDGYVARGPRPTASPGWADARLWKPTGEPIGDAEDMIDDEEETPNGQ